MNAELRRLVSSQLKEKPELVTCLGIIPVTGTQIGEGGKAIIYPVEFGGPAVAKILLENVTVPGSTALERFRDEYRRLVRLTWHPHIVRLFHYDEVSIGTARLPVVLMERCVASLKSFMQTAAPDRPSIFRMVFNAMLPALDLIHRGGIVHRDIKPENILMRDKMTPVLADFGIAWFDPAQHKIPKRTGKGDRLANYLFSAPEQLLPGGTITPAADIYALGQVLYWIATGSVIRGTRYPPIASIVGDLGDFDQTVERMVAQDPKDRLQSVSALREALESSSTSRRTEKFYRHVTECIETFEERVRAALPGSRGLVHLTTRDSIDNLLSSLAADCKTYGLAWTQGVKNNEVGRMAQLDNGRWLIDHEELDVAQVWVFRDFSRIDHCFVLLQAKPLQPFGLYDPPSEQYEEAALFRGRYITRREYDDDYALVDGESVPLTGQAELRIRNLSEKWLFMATKWNPILLSARYSDADKIVASIIEELKVSPDLTSAQVGRLTSLPIHEGSSYFA